MVRTDEGDTCPTLALQPVTLNAQCYRGLPRDRVKHLLNQHTQAAPTTELELAYEEFRFRGCVEPLDRRVVQDITPQTAPTRPAAQTSAAMLETSQR